MIDWFKDTEFWRDLMPIFFHDSNWEKASIEADQGLSLLQTPEGSSILDLACGPGRHALEFARRGFQVTAVDLMLFYLEEGSKRAQAEGLNIEFVQDDMRSFLRPRAFDVVWNFFTSFGYFNSEEDDETVIDNIFQSLRKGGNLLMEMSSREFNISFWSEGERVEHPPIEGITLIEEGRLSDDGSHVFLHWFLVKNGDTTEHNLTLRLYSASEMIALLHKTGFVSIDVFGDLSGSPFSSACKRMVVLATA